MCKLKCQMWNLKPLRMQSPFSSTAHCTCYMRFSSFSECVCCCLPSIYIYPWLIVYSAWNICLHLTWILFPLWQVSWLLHSLPFWPFKIQLKILISWGNAMSIVWVIIKHYGNQGIIWDSLEENENRDSPSSSVPSRPRFGWIHFPHPYAQFIFLNSKSEFPLY